MPDEFTEPQPEQAEQEPQEQADPNDVLKGREDLQGALKNLLTEFGGQEKWPRRLEVLESRQQRFYAEGIQHIYWSQRSNSYATASHGMTFGQDQNTVDMPHYMEDYNIFGPYLDIVTALMSQNPPGVDFEPDDPTQATDISAAQNAEKYRHEVDRQNDRKSVQSSIARYFGTDGRVVLLVEHVADEEKYGTDDAGAPNSAEVLSAFGVLEHKCPLVAKTQADMPFQVISREIDITKAQEDNEDYADEIKPGSTAIGEAPYERLARLGVLQGTQSGMAQAGDAWAHLVTEQKVWFRPCAFKKAALEFSNELKTMFPQGCYVKFIGGTYCGSTAQSMDDCLTIRHPRPGDGQRRSSWLRALVAVQDAFNTYKNLEKEIYDYCVPETYVAMDIIDQEALQERSSEPGNYVPIVLPQGVDAIAKAIYSPPPATAPPAMIEAYNNLQGALSEFMTGCYPALFGGDTKANDTATGIGIQRDQAMARLGLPWGALQELMASAYKQAVILAAKNSADDKVVNVSVPGKRGNASVSPVAMADLAKGNFHCYPDQDSSFPETTGAKRTAFQQLMQIPEMAPILQLPENQELGKLLLGLEDLTIPGAYAEEYAMILLDKLLKEPPIPPDPQAVQMATLQNAAAQKMQALGQPVSQAPMPIPQPQPSVPVDPQMDGPISMLIFQALNRWWFSDEKRQQEEAQNQSGLANVRLYALAQQANAQAIQAAQQQQKVSESLAFKDLPPAGQIQEAGQAGIKLGPKDVAQSPVAAGNA
jgi:hypothetical protein